MTERWPDYLRCPHIGRRFPTAKGHQCSNCGEVMPYTDADPSPYAKQELRECWSCG